MRALAPLAIAAFSLTACTNLPQLDAAQSEAARLAPYPEIVPMSGLLARADALRTPDFGASLPGRASALRARANALRGATVIDEATRARMMAALARHTR